MWIWATVVHLCQTMVCFGCVWGSQSPCRWHDRLQWVRVVYQPLRFALFNMVCFACWIFDFLVCCSPQSKLRSSRCNCLRVPPVARRVLLLCLIFRVGEAKVPGPEKTWTIGHCNPAGLPNKAHLLSESSVDLWLISETHLSSQGYRSFQRHLRAEGSQYQWSVPGKHVMPRSTTSDHGSWTGVLALSSHPTRRLSHDWHPSVFDTSRISVSATYCSGLWVSGVVLYGIPGGPTHPNARLATDALLLQGIQRVAAMTGPRYITGDWNHDLSALPAIDLLRRLNFVEVQELQFQLTGRPPLPTCKQKTRRDYMFISAELVPLFRFVTIDPHMWIDHSAIIATFAGGSADLVRYPWPIPEPLPWSRVKPESLGQTVSFDSGDCSKCYLDFWHQVEQRVVHQLEQTCDLNPRNCCGRASRCKPKKVTGTIAPLKAGRAGEIEPSFFGFSYLHRRWFRQLRRLQSLVRLLGSPCNTANHRDHLVSLWRAILHSPGFKPDFHDCWPTRPIIVHAKALVCHQVPTFEIAQLIFQDFSKQVEDLERSLKASFRNKPQDNTGHGLTALYRAVRRDAPAQVDVLFQTKQAVISQLVPEDQAIVVHPPQEWDDQLPIFAHDQQLQSVVRTPDCLYLESIDGLHVGQAVTQPRKVGRIDDVFQVFIDYWSKFWVKHSDTPYSQWEPVLRFARDRLPRVCSQPLELSVPLIRAAARQKKKSAATGLDGVRRDDLLHLASNEMQSLVSLYRRAAGSGEWPQQTVQGLVKSLAKKPDAMDAPDYRPITIYSMVYRVWSTLQSRFWLSAFGGALSPTLSGNRSGHQASTLWRRVLEEVEFAQANTGSVSSLILDLTKAFNTLPRLPCLAMCLICGMDAPTINAWAGFLGCMNRRFWVNGSVSKPTFSDCGFPEGCGLSCLSMLVLTQAWHEWTAVSGRLPTPLSYVDNWEVVCRDSEGILEAFNRTLEFASVLQLQVDPAKTVAWAVQKDDRDFLRSQGLRTVHDCRDLGAHVVFSRQIRNATVVARFEALSDFWPRLKSAPGSFMQKTRIVRTVAWPRCLHAISGSLVGRKHFHSLRTSLISALQHSKPGANAFVLCWLDDLDPQLTAILATIRDWRSLGSEVHKQIMLSSLRDNPAGFTVGPGSLTQVLIQRMHILGWSLNADGFVTDSIGSFHLVDTCWDDVRTRVHFAWQKVVWEQIKQRKDFTGFLQSDVHFTRQVLATLGAYEAGILRNNLIGMTLTNHHACYWSDSGTALCSHCGADDTLWHRFWTCPHSVDLRSKLEPFVLDLVPALPLTLTERGWGLKSSYHDAWVQMLLAIPTAIQPSSCPDPEGTERINLFTDGSCLWPHMPQYRVAAWGLTFAPSLRLDPVASDSQVVAAGPLPGITQTAYRAELYAVMVALKLLEQWGRKGILWIDCQSVLDRYHLYIGGRKRLNPNGPHHDLWVEICRIVHSCGSDIVQLVKVSAHQVWDHETPAVLRWAMIHNGCVDRVARLANQLRGEDFWSLWQLHSAIWYIGCSLFQVEFRAIRLKFVENGLRVSGIHLF